MVAVRTSGSGGSVPGVGSSVVGAGPRHVSLLATREGWIASVFLLIMIVSTVASVDQGRWATGTEIVYVLSIGAFLLGGLLFHARLRGPIALVLTLLVGFTIVFVIVGHLLPPAEDWGRLFRSTMRGTWTWLTDPIAREAAVKGVTVRSASGTVTMLPPQPLPTIAGAFFDFGIRVADFGYRIALWVQLGSSGKAVTDNTVFLICIGLIAWFQGVIGAWGLFRRQDVVIAALPTGIVLAVNATYSGDARAPFATFLITLLLVAVTLNVAALQRRWLSLRVSYPSGLLFDVTVSSFVVICGLALLSLVGPRLGENPVSNAFWEYMGEQWTDVESASNRFFSGVNNPQRNTGSGRDRLVLAGPAKLTQRVVMAITSDSTGYWRGASYDTWTGREWLTSDRTPVTRTEKQPVIAPRFSRREKVSADIVIQQSKSDLLYVPDEPMTMSVPYRVYGLSPEAVMSDFSALRARRPAIPSLRYQVEGLASRASAEELRNAATDVPDWAKRYTQLPDVPPKVRDLAVTLGRGRRTVYERAQAVESFLRRYPYTLDVKAMPIDRDPVEYFLFDLKQGYCDYFATSMVVLLRAQGIPARLSTGYVTGALDPVTSQYMITEEEAHSWPEVFFPNYGWIAFEPSGYRPAIQRPEVASASGLPDQLDCYEYGYSTFGDCGDTADANAMVGQLNDDTGLGFSPGAFQATWQVVTDVAGFAGWALLGTVLTGLVAFVVYRYAGDYFSRRRPPREAVLHAWWQLTVFSRIAGISKDPTRTPAEFVDAVGRAVVRAFAVPDGASNSRLREIIGVPQGDLAVIARAYSYVVYGGRIPSDEERAAVEAVWHEVRWRLPLVRMFGR